MKVAVLSDIHGNLEALEAVLVDMQGEMVDQVICLGDLVGYGPDPEAVVARVRRRGYACICGNHEAALAAGGERQRMNFQARENNIATAGLLSEDNWRYCCDLPRTLVIGEAMFVHGVPPDSVNRYVYMLEDDEVRRIFAEDSHKLFFVGHTHELMLIFERNGRVIRDRLGVGQFRLEPQRKYLINCGSVGQPRDSDRRSKYLIWDNAVHSLEVRAVEYDVETTVEKIVARGFPRAFAERLR